MICRICKQDKISGEIKSSDFVKGKNKDGGYDSFVCFDCLMNGEWDETDSA